MKTQSQKLAALLRRQQGVTAYEIIMLVGTVCPHRRLSDLKQAGWLITSQKVPGKNYFRYFGKLI